MTPACYDIAQVFSSSDGCLVHIQFMDPIASRTGRLWLWVTDESVTNVHGSDRSALAPDPRQKTRPAFDERRAELVWLDGVARTLTPKSGICLTQRQLSLIHNHLN